MTNEVFKTIQLTGTSKASSDEAIQTAIERAAKTVHNLRWFRVTDTRGHIVNGRVDQWQVSVEVGFTLD